MVDNRYTKANMKGEKPVDIWKRPIVPGMWMASAMFSTPMLVVKVYGYNPNSNEAGFSYAVDASIKPEDATKTQDAGAHVEWEMIGLPGQPPPVSYTSVKREPVTGRPLLGRNGKSQIRQSTCRVRGFDRASS